MPVHSGSDARAASARIAGGGQHSHAPAPEHDQSPNPGRMPDVQSYTGAGREPELAPPGGMSGAEPDLQRQNGPDPAAMTAALDLIAQGVEELRAMVGAAAPTEPPVEPPPGPVELGAQTGPNPVQYSSDEVKAMARADALEQRVHALEREKAIDEKVGELTHRLIASGHDGAVYADRIRELAAERGEEHAELYVSTVLETRPAAPATFSALEAQIGGTGMDEDVQRFASLGPDALSLAGQFGREWDDMRDRGVAWSATRAEHMGSCLERQGFQGARQMSRNGTGG